MEKLSFASNKIKILLGFIFSIILIDSSHAVPVLKPIRVTAELNVGESKDIQLTNNETVNLKLLKVDVVRDSLRNAIRSGEVVLSVDGEVITLGVGNYNLPVEVGKVKIDCPVVKQYYTNNRRDAWKLDNDARFRIWPKDSSYIKPGTFVYPIKQKWFASMTQSGNEPAYVDWGENVAQKKIYYHEGHDFGGAEGMDEIVSATDGIAVFVTGDTLKGYNHFREGAGSDDVYIVDNRGWYIRYSHLDSADYAIKPGAKVKKGQRIGFIGKNGGSGGWVHLHFDIEHINQSTGYYRIEDAYAYLWEAYNRQYNPEIIAVARPHELVWTGQTATLDGRKSVSSAGKIVSYEWEFTDGTKAEGAVQKKIYKKPGEYSEILKVTDSKGNIDYDFMVVQVYDRNNPKRTIPVMHPAYHPSLNIKPGDPVTFVVRTFNSEVGEEIWDFGDGSPLVKTKSEIDMDNITKGKYAEVVHSFSEPGHYIVRIERSDELNTKATAHLHVLVNDN